jgi:hypothetical protein
MTGEFYLSLHRWLKEGLGLLAGATILPEAGLGKPAIAN